MVHLNRYQALADLSHEQQAKLVEDEPSHEDELNNLHNEGTMNSSVAVRQETLNRIRLPEASRVSSKNVQDVSFTQQLLQTRSRIVQRKKRTRRKRKKPGGADDMDEDSGNEDDQKSGDQHIQQDVLLQQAMDNISSSTNSLLYARNIQDIDRVSGTRRATCEPLFQLNQHPRLLRLRRTQRLRKKQGKKRIVAHIKHQIKEHALSVH
ncbi:hypothetical protein BGX28_000326 [Mortierella sp. GBA30]|nr:hypothetical protein BGX28_000326 [Mortierella sp. GBA30]